MPAPISAIVANRYRIIKEIGRGGMGVVYLVKHLNTGDYLALKLIHEHALGHADAIQRFKREMRLPAKIRSEHVVKITDADTAPELDGAPFLVMELLTGCDLSKILTRCGVRSNEEVIWVLSQLMKALDKAHALGIVHRDLKPENVFVHRREDESLIIKILDFGIAKLTEDIRRTSIRDASALKLTSTVGTPHYMAPEQAQGQAPGAPPIGPASDIWAIGMMVFELLTGDTYLRGDDPMELINQLLYKEVEPPSKRTTKLPAEFDGWFLKSCDRDPAKRWPSATAQLTALASALGVTTIPASAPSALTQAVNTVTPPTTISYSFPSSPPRKGALEPAADALLLTPDLASIQSPAAPASRESPPPSGSDSTLDAPPIKQSSADAITLPPPKFQPHLGDSQLHPRQGLIAALATVALIALAAGVLASRSCEPGTGSRSDGAHSPAALPDR